MAALVNYNVKKAQMQVSCKSNSVEHNEQKVIWFTQLAQKIQLIHSVWYV